MHGDNINSCFALDWANSRVFGICRFQRFQKLIDVRFLHFLILSFSCLASTAYVADKEHFAPDRALGTLTGLHKKKMWLKIAVFTTINFLTSLGYLVGFQVWWGFVFAALWAAFCFVKYEYLFWSSFLLFPFIYFQYPPLILPSLFVFYLGLNKPPFERLNNLFRAPATASLVLATFIAIHYVITSEHDLLLGPVIVCYLLYSVSWVMWQKSFRSKSKYLVFSFSWVHVSQAITLLFEGPHWFLWLPSTLCYLFVSLVLWFLIGLHLRRIHIGEPV